MDILNEKDHNDAAFAIEKMKMSDLALILEIYFCEFKKKLNLLIEEEKGKSILKMVTKSIFTNIQIKLTEIMEE